METFTFEQLPSAIAQLTFEVKEIKRLILEKSPESSQETDQILNVQQTSELISLSIPTIYGLVHQSMIPFMKKGKKLYFSKVELISWIKTGRRKTKAEIISEANQLLVRKKGLYHGK